MRKIQRRNNMTVGVIAIFMLFIFCNSFASDDLPVRVPDFTERRGWIRNPFTFEALHNISKIGDKKGLYIDLGNPKLQGVIHAGP